MYMLESVIYFSVSIADCKYTCHRRCRDDVDLDCTGGWQFERNLSVDEMTMKTLHLIDQVMLICTCLVWSLVVMISLIKIPISLEALSPFRQYNMEFKPRSSSYSGCVCCWLLSFLRGIFLRSCTYLPLKKTDISKFQFDLETTVKQPQPLSWLYQL